MFQAPDTDIDPTASGGFQAPDTDADAPSTLGENIVSNLGRDINPVNLAKGFGEQTKQGALDMPLETINTIAQKAGEAVGGEKVEPEDETPLEKTLYGPTMEKRAEETISSPIVQNPKEYAYKNPVDAALLAATPVLGFLGAGEGTETATEGKNIPDMGTETPKPNPEPTETPVPPTEETPKGTPLPTPNQEVTKDPLQDVKDYINSKYQNVASKPGIAQRMAKLLDAESTNLGAKDLGLMGRQIQSMGEGFQGLEKAKQLVNYAREKGYFDPTLTDVARKDLIQTNMDTAGKQLGALRDLASKRGQPPIEEIRNTLQTQLTDKYGIDAPNEINKVLAKFDKKVKADPTFKGLADLATELNKDKTSVKAMAQHPGPTTDGANIVSRINNDAARKFFNPQENDLYTQSLRDFGANKKLEQATAAASRRNMSARSNQRGILGRLYQEALDRGGYRIGGNIANKTAQAVLKNPKIQTLPQFFEELGHQSDDALDETINGMAYGGRIPQDIKNYVQGRSQTK